MNKHDELKLVKQAQAGNAESYGRLSARLPGRLNRCFLSGGNL